MRSPEPSSKTAQGGRRFQFQCRRCGSVLEALAEQASTRGHCPGCDAEFVIPEMDPRTGLARDDADPGHDGELPAPVHAYAAAGSKAPRLVRMPDDSLQIECPRCQEHAEVTADRCPRCGLPFTMEGALTTAHTSRGTAGMPALVAGIIAVTLSFCPVIGLVPAAIAIGVGVHVIVQGEGKTLGYAGVGLGLLALAIAVFVLANGW